MTIQELEQVTREYLWDIYKRKYIGDIVILKLDPVGYSVTLGIPSCVGQGMTFYAEVPDEQFLKLFKDDLRSRMFHYTDFGELNLRDYHQCQDDERRTYREDG